MWLLHSAQIFWMLDSFGEMSSFVDEFALLGGNFSIRAGFLKQKIEMYIEKNENKEVDIQIKDVLRLLKAYENGFIYGHFPIYETREIVQPVIVRLLSSKLIFEDVRIGQAALFWAEDIEVASLLAEKLLSFLNNTDRGNIHKIKFAIHTNLLERILVAEIKELNPLADLEKIKDIEVVFRKHLKKALSISKNYLEDFKEYRIYLLIKEAIYNMNFQEVDSLLVKFKQLASCEFYRAVRTSVWLMGFYGGNFLMTEKQFKEMCGKNLRNIREIEKIEPLLFSYSLGITVEELEAIENGEISLDAYLLFKIIHKFDIQLEELLHGPDILKKFQKK